MRIIASISWGCVGDGNGGISQRSSQSNGIYVQHSGLQPGNKCLSPPRSHFLTPSLAFSLCQFVTSVSSISVFLLSPVSLYLVLILSAFCVHCILSITCFLSHRHAALPLSHLWDLIYEVKAEGLLAGKSAGNKSLKV